jgi:hypothetical protein
VNEARRHHYVSQFYLRNFAVAAATPQLYVADLKTKKTFLTSTINVAQERDFHRIDVPGHEPNAVEAALADFEGKVALALDSIRQRAEMGDDDNAHVLQLFMSLLLVKNPAMRDRIDDVTDRIMSMTSKIEAANEERFVASIKRRVEEGALSADIDAVQLREALMSDDFEVAIAREFHLNLEFTNARDLLRYFVGRNWTFLKAETGQFITSDRPVVLTREKARPNVPPGLAHPDVLILFPLSSDSAVLGGLDVPPIAVTLSREEVAETNGQIILNATRQVYAQDATFEYKFGLNPVKPAADLLHDAALNDDAPADET